MKKWNAPVVEELNITETANGFPWGKTEKTIDLGCLGKYETWGPEDKGPGKDESTGDATGDSDDLS